MAARPIVTSHPVVSCDVCGRRLLRGETPDVFLAGGQRRTVCELCVPRAAAEGWRRESERHDLSLRPPRQRRAGSLLGRLRQLREPQQRPLPHSSGPSRRRTAIESEGLYNEQDGLYELIEEAEQDRLTSEGQAVFIGAVPAQRSRESLQPGVSGQQPAQSQPSGRELALERALEVFNEGETPQRVAGVSRSLGVPTVVVRPSGGSPSKVAIVVAWELCWYRYEVDLDEELAGAQLIGEGMELDELPAEDRVANAAADERGELALLSA
jgi:hypothetical protein